MHHKQEPRDVAERSGTGGRCLERELFQPDIAHEQYLLRPRQQCGPVGDVVATVAGGALLGYGIYELV